jgi:kynurenine formamidase
VFETIPEWASELAAAHSAAADPRRGSFQRIDNAARLRGVRSVERGELFALGRPLETGGDQSYTGKPHFELEVHVEDTNALTVGTDRISIDCHGLGITHMDAINHLGVGGRWHGGVDARASGPSVADWAVGLVTRGVFLDVTEARRVAAVEIDAPVTDGDLDRALELAGTDIESGDALMVYMGRDSFESTHGPLKPLSRSPEGRPGIGTSGAEWIAKQPAGALLWDMLDASNHEEEDMAVHLLLWAQGLALIDNCDLGLVRNAMAARRSRTCLLMVAPLNIPGGTGSAVNPLLML